MKIFELFSFLLDQLKKQGAIINDLKNENLGLVDIPAGTSVEDILLKTSVA